MDTSRKRKRTEDGGVEGYVSKVSPLKLSKNEKTRYFTAQMQTNKETSVRLVCFSPEKHVLFKTAEQSDDTFRICNGSMEPDRDGGTVVKVFQSSVLQSCKKRLDFKKEYGAYLELEKEIIEQAPKKISEEKTEYEMVTVEVKFQGFTSKEPITVPTRYGERRIITGVIADDTGANKLVVWSEDLAKLLKPSESYRITNLRNKLFEQQSQLNTTSQTKVVSITPVTNVSDDLTLLKEEKLETIFDSVQISNSVKCSICKKPLDQPENLRTVKCPHCQYKQICDKLLRSITIQMNTSSQMKLILKEAPLNELLQKGNKPNIINDSDALEDYFILNGPFELTHTSNAIITSIFKK